MRYYFCFYFVILFRDVTWLQTFIFVYLNKLKKSIIGEGPFPGVVDMFGAIGGLLEYRSAQLASRGIASLALAFFGYDDLPESMEEFDLEYFKEAVNILLSHKKVSKCFDE